MGVFEIAQAVQKGVDACLSLPVEVRDDDFTLRAKGRLKEVYASLDKGDYLFTVLLPNNTKYTMKVTTSGNIANDFSKVIKDVFQQIQKQGEIKSTAFAERYAPSDVVKGTQPGILSNIIAGASGAVLRMAEPILKQIGMDTRAIPPAVDSSVVVASSIPSTLPSRKSEIENWSVRVYRGNPLFRDGLRDDDVLTKELMRGTVEIKAASDDRVVQLLELGRSGVNFMIPPDSRLQLELVVDHGARKLRCHFADADADRIIAPKSQGYFEHLSDNVHDVDGDRVVALLRKDYGAGLAFCYALLRSTDLNPLRKILGSEDNRVLAHLRAILSSGSGYDKRADMRILQGELLARSDEHDAALRQFSTAAETGLPCFTTGLNTLLDRLHFYAMADASAPDAARPSSGVTGSIARLRKFAANCDQDLVMLCFFGLHPSEPGGALAEQHHLVNTAVQTV